MIAAFTFLTATINMCMKLNRVPVNILKDVDSLYIYDHKDVYTILPDFEMRKTDTATFFQTP